MPELVRRLIRATVEPTSLKHLNMPSEEGISKPGVDGLVKVRDGNDPVPRGTSVWEIGRGRHYRAKAQSDYRKRTAKPPPGVDPARATFVFVTPHRWAEPSLSEWQQQRRAEGAWRDVKVIDADKLIEWIRAAPPVEVWLAEHLGWPSPLRSLERAWREWSRATTPASSEALVLAGRDEQREALRGWLERSPGVLQIDASHPDEAVAFCWASLRHLPASVRERWLSQALVVRTEDELRRLSVERTPMLLLARGCGVGLSRLAAEGGHHVVLTDAHGVEGALELGPLDPPRVEVALENMGYGGDARRLLVELRGALPGVSGISMSALRRALGDIGDNLATELAPLVLAGAWTEQPADVEAVSELLGESPERLRALQRRHSGVADAPLVAAGERWRWASRRDAWRQLEQRLVAGDLKRFEKVVVRVIEDDVCSGELRAGLLEGVLLLAAASSRSDGQELADRVALRLLRRSGRDWVAQDGRGLQWLAEAAPTVFLRCTREELDKGDPSLDWVWALEILAWSDEHLFDVSELLAKIADSGNRKAADQANSSFHEIYQTWNPHTSASAEARAKNLETLARQHPEFILDQLLHLLRNARRGSSRDTVRPQVRGWDRERGRGQVAWEFAHHCRNLWAQVLRMVEGVPRLWIRVFPELTKLPLDDELRDQALEALCDLDVEQFDTPQRVALRQALRATIHRHREFADANWSWPETWLDRLEQLHDRLAPERAVDAVAWLFDRGPALLRPLPRDASWQSTEANLQATQRDAAQRLRESSTTAELVALAERVGDPRALGYALGRLEEAQPPMALLTASLDMDAKAGAEFRRGLGRALYEVRKFDAVREGSLASLPASAQAELLLGYPWWPSTWDVIEGMEPDVVRAYWWRAPTAPFEKENVERLLRSILGIGRIGDALELAESALTLNRGTLDPALLIELLDAAAREFANRAEMHSYSHALHSHSDALHTVLERLRAEGRRWHEDVLRLEQALLPSLDLFAGHHPKALYAKLAEDPAEFVELVRFTHPQPEMDEASRSNYQRAQHLLFHWNTLPGQHGSNLDFEKLSAWVRAARTQLRQAGLGEVGDDELGKVLARVPACAGELWPPEALCRLLEEIDAPQRLEDALTNEHGMIRSMQGDGLVDPERDIREVEALRTQARSMRERWPRMARLIERLAQGREHSAHFWRDIEDERRDWTARATTKERLDAALDKLEASGSYVFHVNDLDEPLRRARDLRNHIAETPRVAPLPGGAYVIVRPEYRQLGAPPPSWFIDELMRRAEVDYCVGLLSAAALHGAGDQRPQVFQVLVASPMAPARVGKLAIEFVHRERVQIFDAHPMNTETGTMAVATPEATVFDLAEFFERCGGRAAVIAVYEDLLDNIDTDVLVQTSAHYPARVVEQTATLIGEAGHPKIAAALRATATIALGA